MSKGKKIAIAAGLVLTLTIAGVAFAYWTASGTGSGDATAGTDNGVSISDVSFLNGPAGDGTLYPDATVDVSFKITNDSSNTAAKVGDVVADTSEGTNGFTVDSGHSACDLNDFHYSGTTLNDELAASASKTWDDSTSPTGGTVTMDNTSSNQDACQGATITLHLKTDNSGI